MKISSIARVFLGILHIILSIGNLPDKGIDREILIIKIQFFQYFFQHIFAVISIINNKIRSITTKFINLHAQKTCAKSMKSKKPDIFCRRSDHFVDTSAHFSRCLVGKSYGQNFIRCYTLLEQPCNTASKSLCFTGTGTCHNQHWPFCMLYCCRLFFVQSVQNFVHVFLTSPFLNNKSKYNFNRFAAFLLMLFL